MIDDTVRVELDGPAIATTVRTGVDTPTPGGNSSEETPELRGAKRRIAIAEAGLAQARAALERLGASTSIADDPSDDAPAAWDAIVSARRAVVALRTARELALREQLATAVRELDEAQLALDAAADRDRRTGSARPAKLHEVRKYVDIELVANGAAAPVTIHLEYLVAAARWAPTYVARLEGERVSVEVRAVVAQDTGEDWTAVPLRLSTAEPTRFAQLPELAAQRIGRRQHEPARAGFRAPPVGADALYADFDRDVTPLRKRVEHRPKSGEVTRHTTVAAGEHEAPYEQQEQAKHRAPTVELPRSKSFAQENWDEESSAPKAAFSTPHAGSPMPHAPSPPRQQALAPERASRLRGAVGEGAAGVKRPPAPEPASPTIQLDYANLVMAPPSSLLRGRLIAASHHPHRDAEVELARARVDTLPLPRGCHADWTHTYDYAFATDGSVDVRADGAWHSIAVTAKSSGVKLHHVAVPREQADVFRVAAIPNPFAGPLLPGPIDVYDRGRFLLTSTVDYTPPGAAVDVGLGVDAAVKIARNSEFREEATGMLRGALRLHHAITIDIENVSGRSVELEVRERVPVTREGDDEIEVTITKIDPAWERWTPDADAPAHSKLRGGHRWRLVVPAGQKRTLRAGYEVKIPGKAELRRRQSERVVNAPIVAVTVLEDRAAITRRGAFGLSTGQHRITVERVSPILADKTLTATATGARVLDVRCERYLAPWRDPGTQQDEPVAKLRDERTRLEAERDAFGARARAAAVEVAALGEVVEAALRDLAVAAARGVQASAAAAQLAELDQSEAQARGRVVDAQLAANDIARALDRLNERIARAEAEAGEEAARLVIDLVADAAADVVVTIGYIVPGAAWRPYHRAVLDRSASRVDWQTTACVWQATGEDWIDAALTCSLERPSLGVEPPALADDELRARRRPDSVVVEAREHEQQTAGLGGGHAQVPGIDDGGLGLVLSAAKTTVRADGTPHRVPVGGFTAATQLALVAIPLRSPWVHLRARIVNTGTTPLLAGPVDLIMASGYVGRAEIGFVAAGEKFYVGFGPESDVRVHRTETREHEDAGLLGGWNTQTVRVAVRLSNLGAQAREIVVTERIPISEVEQVDVTASAPDAYLLGTDDQPRGEDITQVTARALDERGMVTWSVELPPLGRRAVTLEYRVKSQRGVTGI